MESVKGFFDLCVNEASINESTIKTLYKHGYRTIAINYEVNEEEQVENRPQGKKKRKGENQANEPEKSLFPQVKPFTPIEGCDGLTVLFRLTVHLATKEFYAKISKMSEFKKFHIIAVLPLNQQIFSVCCTEIEADILTFKSHYKAEFKVLRKHYNQCLAHGYHFELLYAPTITNESSRRVMISNAHSLHVVGKSRNVIISSGIKSAVQIRSPYDVINLGLIFGLNQAQSKMAVMQNGRNVYCHAVSRRYGKIAMLCTNVAPIAGGEECTQMDVSVIELDDDDDEDVADVGHQLKKIKT